MWSVLVPCSDAIVIYSCLSYTSVVLYLSASKSLTLTSVILHIHVSNYYTCSISTFTAPNSSSSDSNESNVSEYTLLQVEVQQLLSPRREIGTLFKYCVIRRVHSTLYFRVTPCPANLPSMRAVFHSAPKTGSNMCHLKTVHGFRCSDRFSNQILCPIRIPSDVTDDVVKQIACTLSS